MGSKRWPARAMIWKVPPRMEAPLLKTTATVTLPNPGVAASTVMLVTMNLPAEAPG